MCGSRAAYAEYSRLTQELNKQINLRGMLKFKAGEKPVQLEQVRDRPAPLQHPSCLVEAFEATDASGE